MYVVWKGRHTETIEDCNLLIQAHPSETALTEIVLLIILVRPMAKALTDTVLLM